MTHAEPASVARDKPDETMSNTLSEQERLERVQDRLEVVRGLVARASSETQEGTPETVEDVILEAGAELGEARRILVDS